MRRRLAAHLIVMAAGLLSYWGVWQFGFVSYDDPDYVSQNPVVQQGLSAGGIRWAFTTSHAANWHPLTWISLETVASLFGATAASMHTANLILHLLASALLLELFLGLGLGLLLSAGLAGLFAVHPAHVESVAWVSEHKDVLSGSLGLASLCFWLRFGRERSRRSYAAALVLLGLGLLAKPMLVSWPLLYLLLNRWPLQREDSFASQLVEIWPAFALAAGAAAATVWAQSAGGAVIAGYELGPWPRVANALVSLWRYPAMLLWPHDLSFLYPHPDLTPALGGSAGWKVAAAGAACAGVALGWRRFSPMLRTGLLFYLLTVLPTLGLIQVGPQSHADRYSYLPSVGLLLALACLLRSSRWLSRVALPAALLLCVWLARGQVGVWRDDDSLYSHALAVNPGNWLAAGNYAKLLGDRGENQRAEELYRSALSQRPRDATTLYNLGTLYLKLGRLAEAERELGEAIAESPRNADALNNLSQILARRGEHAAAVAHLQRATVADPRNPDVRVNLADSLRRIGRAPEALEHLREVLETYPRHARALDVLARIHFAGDTEAALHYARRATRAEPDNPIYLETLARVEQRLGNAAEALASCNRALELARQLGQSERVARLEEFARGLRTEILKGDERR